MKQIFVSVGRTWTDEQETFVGAVEELLRSRGLEPCTLGRNKWTHGQPLRAVRKLMDECEGTIVLAFERVRIESGLERAGSPLEQPVAGNVPTVWNQIEAAMAYLHDHPLLVLAEQNLRLEGMLEPTNDWYVHKMAFTPASLFTQDFKGLFGSWMDALHSGASSR
jgi:hypothetical protein